MAKNAPPNLNNVYNNLDNSFNNQRIKNIIDYTNKKISNNNIGNKNIIDYKNNNIIINTIKNISELNKNKLKEEMRLLKKKVIEIRKYIRNVRIKIDYKKNNTNTFKNFFEKIDQSSLNIKEKNNIKKDIIKLLKDIRLLVSGNNS